MKKRVALFGSTILAFLLIGLLLYEPQQCPLCQAEQSDVPCLIDLCTGEIGEMRIGHGELSDDPTSFVFFFVEVAGCDGYCDTAAQCCYLRTDEKTGTMNRFAFCRTCRAKLHNVRKDRYAILDLRTAEAEIYPIDNNTDIRQYHIQHTTEGIQVNILDESGF